jgi:hypothetical protein
MGARSLWSAVAAAVLLLAPLAGPSHAAEPSLDAAPQDAAAAVAIGGFATPTGNGYWLVHADGTVHAHGDATFHGDASALPLNGPIVGGAATPTGAGYWLVASDGGIFSYGDARFFGSMGGTPLNRPVFSVAPTPTGAGYWLVASDGGIFGFGDAAFHGSTGALVLNEPIAGIVPSASGAGYTLVARDGGVFGFGDVPFLGSLPGLGMAVDDVVGIAHTEGGAGYWVAQARGTVTGFGTAPDHGDFPGGTADPVAGVVANPAAPGYLLVLASGRTVPHGTPPGGGTGVDAFAPGPGDSTWFCASAPSQYQCTSDIPRADGSALVWSCGASDPPGWGCAGEWDPSHPGGESWRCWFSSGCVYGGPQGEQFGCETIVVIPPGGGATSSRLECRFRSAGTVTASYACERAGGIVCTGDVAPAPGVERWTCVDAVTGWGCWGRPGTRTPVVGMAFLLLR